MGVLEIGKCTHRPIRQEMSFYVDELIELGLLLRLYSVRINVDELLALRQEELDREELERLLEEKRAPGTDDDDHDHAPASKSKSKSPRKRKSAAANADAEQRASKKLKTASSSKPPSSTSTSGSEPQREKILLKFKIPNKAAGGSGSMVSMTGIPKDKVIDLLKLPVISDVDDMLTIANANSKDKPNSKTKKELKGLKAKTDPALGPFPCCLCVSQSLDGLLRVHDPPFLPPGAASASVNYLMKDREGKEWWRAHARCAMVVAETWVDEVEVEVRNEGEGEDAGKRMEKVVFGVDSIVKDRWALVRLISFSSSTQTNQFSFSYPNAHILVSIPLSAFRLPPSMSTSSLS